jgi:hypothetical protein
MEHRIVLIALLGGLCGLATPSLAAAKQPLDLKNAAEPSIRLVGLHRHALASAPDCGAPACATPAPACVTPAPSCCAPAPCCPTPCCPAPKIVYRHRHVHQKVCCGCCEPAPISIVLSAKMPCTGCPVEIPLCIPGCTTGAPKVCCDTGIFGRDVQWYEWPNGFAAKVAFTHHGDVIVTTYGS